MECAEMTIPQRENGLAERPEPTNPVVDFDGLARLLHRDRATLVADRCRAPHRVPPAYRVPGTRQPLWLVDDVLQWLREHREYEVETPRPGRPRKAEQVRRERRPQVTQRNNHSVAGRSQP